MPGRIRNDYTRQNTRAIRTTDNHIDVLRFASRHKSLQGLLVIEECIAPGQEQCCGPNFTHVNRQFAGFDTIHTETPRLDAPLLLQPVQRAECPRAGTLELSNPLVTVEIPATSWVQTKSR